MEKETTETFRKNQLRNEISKLFLKWTALNLAVEHGMGGSLSRWTAVIDDFTCEVAEMLTDATVSQQTLAEALELFMNQAFDTVLEDNSHNEIARELIRSYHSSVWKKTKVNFSQWWASCLVNFSKLLSICFMARVFRCVQLMLLLEVLNLTPHI